MKSPRPCGFGLLMLASFVVGDANSVGREDVASAKIRYQKLKIPAFWPELRANRSAPLIKKIYVHDFNRFGLKDVGL